MRTVNVADITAAVARMAVEANTTLPGDLIAALEAAREREESPVGRRVLDQILANDRLAAVEGVPACQDTGLAVFFVTLGQEVHLEGGGLIDAINEGVRRGYKDGFLRKSTCHPFTRKNVGDNTPAVVHVDLVPGDRLTIAFAPKGGGSENMSTVTMLKPSQGRAGVVKAVIDWVRQSGGNPCPPTIVGVGVGGNFERSAILAKKALLRPVGQPNPDPDMAALEAEILAGIEKTGVGPMGLGGRVTAFAVHALLEPCHIASFPLAINIQCHAARHKEVEL
jgi:fumarate hydratase subunit alpha